MFCLCSFFVLWSQHVTFTCAFSISIRIRFFILFKWKNSERTSTNKIYLNSQNVHTCFLLDWFSIVHSLMSLYLTGNRQIRNNTKTTTSSTHKNRCACEIIDLHLVYVWLLHDRDKVIRSEDNLLTAFSNQNSIFVSLYFTTTANSTWWPD